MIAEGGLLMQVVCQRIVIPAFRELSRWEHEPLLESDGEMSSRPALRGIGSGRMAGWGMVSAKAARGRRVGESGREWAEIGKTPSCGYKRI